MGSCRLGSGHSGSNGSKTVLCLQCPLVLCTTPKTIRTGNNIAHGFLLDMAMIVHIVQISSCCKLFNYDLWTAESQVREEIEILIYKRSSA